ncbi:unnamed protein product [Gadus morhua 'NCC']
MEKRQKRMSTQQEHQHLSHVDQTIPVALTRVAGMLSSGISNPQRDRGHTRSTLSPLMNPPSPGQPALTAINSGNGGEAY